MIWDEQLTLKFASFHTKRMNGSYQGQHTNDFCVEFYAKQSMEIFIKLKGDVSNYVYW